MNTWMIGMLLVANIALNAGGSALLKLGATSGNAFAAVMGCSCYVLGSGLYIVLLQHQPLSVMAMVTSILGLVSVVLIGVFAFGETLSLTQSFGLVFGIGAVILISLSSLTS